MFKFCWGVEPAWLTQVKTIIEERKQEAQFELSLFETMAIDVLNWVTGSIAKEGVDPPER